MKIKKLLINILLLLFCCLLQFSGFLRLYGASANFLLCFVVCLSVSEQSPAVAVIFSGVAGLLSDFFSGGLFGHRTFWAIVTAYISVALLYRLFSRNFKTALAIYTVSHLVTNSLYYLLYSFGKTGVSFFGELWSDFLPSFALSLPVLAVIYIIYSRFYYKNPDVRIYGKVGFRR